VQTLFSHRRHRNISCQTCHDTSDRHGGLLVRTRAECMACHHRVSPPPAPCAACHRPREIDGQRTRSTPMNMTVWDGPRTRTLPFDHAWHRAVACRDCHTRPPSFAVGVTCNACHEQHHRPEADCMLCHVPVNGTVHPREAHLTCTAAGCHQERTIAALPQPATRNVCLACHQDMIDHEPGRDCAQCHMIRPVPARLLPEAQP
jgi:hypothetical protein